MLPVVISNSSTKTHPRMISSLQIKGYRGFSALEMSGLERVNLLVGKNNSGKTSALEAIFLLISRGDPSALWQVLWRRGERLTTSADRVRDRAPDLDVSHLFTGHALHLGSTFNLSAKNQNAERYLNFTLSEIKSEKDATSTNKRERLTIPSRLGLEVKGFPPPPIEMLPLSQAGGLDSDVLQSPRRLRREVANELSTQYITADSLDSSDLVSLWDKVALTPNEDRVMRALRFLDLDVERIAPQVGGQFYYSRGGFIVKLAGFDHPVPIGSMGDGMWRMMANMWRLIFGAAKELNVQVFASTHSSDCIRSLAELCYLETDVADNVTLQRIERDKENAVAYTAEEIEIAAERRVEVR